MIDERLAQACKNGLDGIGDSTDANILADSWVYEREQKENLQVKNIDLRAKLTDAKSLAERNHRANMMPCPKCGYQQLETKPLAANRGEK